MFSYSQSIGRPGTSLPTLYYLSNVYALKLLVPTSTNTKKLIISHWCYFQFELILPHGTMVLKCTPKKRNAIFFYHKVNTNDDPCCKKKTVSGKGQDLDGVYLLEENISHRRPDPHSNKRFG